MQQRLIGHAFRSLRPSGRRGNERGATREIDIATLGLKERVRDEWESRQRGSLDVEFGLPELLSSLHSALARKPVGAGRSREESPPKRLPKRRLGRDGHLYPVDDAFFARREYAVDELIDFADTVFVEMAYRCLLKRSSDPSGFAGFLRPLREDKLDRVDVLRVLLESAEGKQHAVMIHGMRKHVFWRRAENLRVAGPLIRWCRGLMELGTIARRLRMLEVRAEAGYQETTGRLDGLAESDMGRNRQSIAALEKSQVRIEAAVVGLTDRYRRFLLETEMRDAARRDGES